VRGVMAGENPRLLVQIVDDLRCHGGNIIKSIYYLKRKINNIDYLSSY
jgi:hypothetical protein